MENRIGRSEYRVGGPVLILPGTPALSPYQRLCKRVFDMVVGLGMLLLLLPLMGLVALAIKLDSRGTVVFRQQRVGENGKVFWMYKFRSMVMDAEALPNDKCMDDPRVTRVGRFMRRTSLDELPQLVNVLKGEMSLVGPRPEMTWMVNEYKAWQRTRFAVPQGITGWWQINSRDQQPMSAHTEDDLYYIQNYSIWLDIWIILRTIPAVLRRRGAF